MFYDFMNNDSNFTTATSSRSHTKPLTTTTFWVPRTLKVVIAFPGWLPWFNQLIRLVTNCNCPPAQTRSAPYYDDQSRLNRGGVTVGAIPSQISIESKFLLELVGSSELEMAIGTRICQISNGGKGSLLVDGNTTRPSRSISYYVNLNQQQSGKVCLVCGVCTRSRVVKCKAGSVFDGIGRLGFLIAVFLGVVTLLSECCGRRRREMSHWMAYIVRINFIVATIWLTIRIPYTLWLFINNNHNLYGIHMINHIVATIKFEKLDFILKLSIFRKKIKNCNCYQIRYNHPFNVK